MTDDELMALASLFIAELAPLPSPLFMQIH